ncbi:MAG: type II restriction endonuclease [Candidatus Helarchaeota archaeon]
MSINITFYQKKFPGITEEELIDSFQKNLIKTNRDHKFFVDWEKVQKNAEIYKYELNLLNVLIRKENLEEEFIKLLKKYPEVVRSFPILIAIRDLEISIIEDFSERDVNIKEYSFNVEKDTNLMDNEISNYYAFIEKTGIIKLFNIVKDFYDYVMGVEVGMDTNARKNRGGKAMELVIEPILNDIVNKYELKMYTQKKFKHIKNEHDIKIPNELENRKCDFILVNKKSYLNIEVNYYAGSGSKPEEIVDAYINRFREINNAGGNFIWITDGEVWKSSNQIIKAFNNLPYVLNIYFIRQGILEEAIKNIFNLE